MAKIVQQDRSPGQRSEGNTPTITAVTGLKALCEEVLLSLNTSLIYLTDKSRADS